MKKISSAFAVCIAASSLLFSGCISSKRMERISPLSESDGTRMSASRTNAWPIYYGTGAGFSVLWPFLDFDEKGWAFRPFYVQEGNERSVLWPLSGWDEKGGWALTAYWRNGRGFGAFPLFHFSTDGADSWDFNYVFPFWWMNDWSDWGVFPLGGVGNDDWRLLNFYYENTDIRAHWNFWPFLYRKSNIEKDSVDWRLLYGLLGGYKDNRTETVAWLLPLFGAWNDKDSDDYAAWVFPTFFGKREDNVSFNTFLPFYFYAENGNDDYAFITPLGWRSENGDSETTVILPLYYYNTRGNGNYVFATPLGGLGKFSDGGHLHYALGPLYIDYALPADDYEFSSVLWPIYMRSRDGNEESTYLFPLGHRWTDGEESRRGFLLGLGATRSRDEKTSWAIWPLYGSRNDFGDADFRYWLTLAGSNENSACKKNSNWLFPFYYYSNDDSGCGGFDNEFYALCYLFGVENSYHSNRTYYFENYFFPFYSYESRTKCDENGVPEDKPYNSEFMIPLIYGFDTSLTSGAKEKNREHWALLNLFNFRKRNYAAIPRMREYPAQSLLRDSCERYVNTFWETRTFRVWKDGALTPREQKIVEYGNGECYYGVHSRSPRLIKRKDGSDRDCYSRFDFDKEIFGENPDESFEVREDFTLEQERAYWNERASKRAAFYRRELLKILRNKGIPVADDADKDAMFAAVQKLIEENTEILTEKEFQVWPFYESQDDAFGGYEKELLWGLWYSRGNADESFTSCAKYLYRRETTKDGTKLDVFPFISVDTGKRGAFSFLGNFFKIVSDDEKGWSGNVLFIPWGCD